MRVPFLAILLLGFPACKTSDTGSSVKDATAEASVNPDGNSDANPEASTDGSAISAGGHDVQLEDGSKHCFHTALRASLAQAVRNMSKGDIKDWSGTKGGGLIVAFDPDKKEERKNGDVVHKLKEDSGLGEDDLGPVVWANYKVKVHYKSGGKIEVRANFNTESCSGPSVDSDPKPDKSDAELGDYGKCSVAAMRAFVAWGLENLAEDKDIDKWSDIKGGNIDVRKMKRNNHPDVGAIEYKAHVTNSRANTDKKIVVSMTDSCKIKNVSADFNIDDDVGI